MNPSNSLLNVHRIPWEIEIEKDTSELQVDTLSSGSSADKHAGAIRLFEFLLSRNFYPVISTAKHDNTLSRISRFNFPTNEIDRSKISREDDYFLILVLSPKR